jgi:hypothetical protein
MESSQALLKYKAKLQSKKQSKPQSKKQTTMPITHLTQREIEWLKKLCPTFHKNINTVMYFKKR